MRLRAPSEAVLYAAVAALGVVVLSMPLARDLASIWSHLGSAAPMALVPLYTRIGKPDILLHGTRGRLYTTIGEEPGIHAHELARRLGIGWGTAMYHLRLLEETHLVTCQRAGRYKRFFRNSGGFTGRKEAVCALRNATTALLWRFVLDHPGCTQKDASLVLGMNPSLVSWHATRLEAARLIARRRDGRNVRYRPGELCAEPLAPLAPAPVLTGVAA